MSTSCLELFSCDLLHFAQSFRGFAVAIEHDVSIWHRCDEKALHLRRQVTPEIVRQKCARLEITSGDYTKERTRLLQPDFG